MEEEAEAGKHRRDVGEIEGEDTTLDWSDDKGIPKTTYWLLRNYSFIALHFQ